MFLKVSFSVDLEVSFSVEPADKFFRIRELPRNPEPVIIIDFFIACLLFISIKEDLTIFNLGFFIFN